MHSHSPASRGAITAEWALALPAVILVASVLFAGVGLLLERSRLDSAAADIVRLIGLGVGHSEAVAHAEQGFGGSLGAKVNRDPSQHRVCVAVTRGGGGHSEGFLTGLHPEGLACGLAIEPHDQ